MPYTVKKAAALAGVTVRTLHHYDQIGLLSPAALTQAGYRLYSDDDMARLQQILFFRELGFALTAIGAILERPDFDRAQALARHRALLAEKQRRLQTLMETLDRTIASIERGTPMDTRDLFDGFDPAAYEEEARERWGDTEAYKQSAARTARYTKADWAEIQGEMAAIDTGLAALMERDPADPAVQALIGRDPADPAVQALIGRWHRVLHERFYDCPPAMLRGLGDMYVADPRFTRNIDKTRPGLSAFKRLAMHAYADREEAAPGPS